MKKVILIIAVFFYSCCFSQDIPNKKFQFGVSYSLTNDNEVFNNPISVYTNYKIKEWGQLDMNIGLRAFYFSTKQNANFSSKLGFNPNINSSYFFNPKWNSYLALGYYFDSFKFKPTNIGSFTNQTRDIKTNGITITPGLKYFVHSNIFIDTNLTLLFAKEHDDFGTSVSVNDSYFNFGLGIVF